MKQVEKYEHINRVIFIWHIFLLGAFNGSKKRRLTRLVGLNLAWKEGKVGNCPGFKEIQEDCVKWLESLAHYGWGFFMCQNVVET